MTRIQLGNFEDAIEATTGAIEMRPDYGKAWFLKSVCLKELQRLPEALHAAEKACEYSSQLNENEAMGASTLRNELKSAI